MNTLTQTVCSEGHVHTSDCRRDGCPCLEEHTHEKERAYCDVHLTSRPGKDQFGNWYAQCWTGHQLNEKCKIIVVKGDEL